jgi:hypothetical protein
MDRVFQPLVESIDLLIQLLIQGVELVPTMGGVRRQDQPGKPCLTVAIPESVAAAHPMIERDGLQRALHARPHPDPLVAMQKQRSQIPQLRRRQPDRWKAILGQQRQQQARIASIMFLPPGLRLPNFRRMSDVARNPELVHQAQESPHRPRRFDPDDHRRGQRPVELPDHLAFML